MKLPHIKSTLLLVIFLGVVVPFMAGYVLNIFAYNWLWEGIPLHAVVESLGAFIALAMAVLLLGTMQQSENNVHNLWPALALIGMGTFDLFHSFSEPGNTFVFYHSFAVFVGGLLFCFSWISLNHITNITKKISAWMVGIVSMSTALFFLINADAIPSMIADGQFTMWAKFLNVAGGILFFAATIRFLLAYQKKYSWKLFFLALLCSLFGGAGILFESSSLWDAPWWVWHALRLWAYVSALVYMYTKTKSVEEEIRKNALDLVEKYKRLEELNNQVKS